MRCSEVDTSGNIRRAATRPKAKRFTSETLTDKDLLLLAILALWRADFCYSMLPIDEEDSLQWSITFTRIWDSEADTSVKISAATTFQCLVDMFFRMSPEDPDYAYFEDRLKQSLWVTCHCSYYIPCLLYRQGYCTLVSVKETSHDQT